MDKQYNWRPVVGFPNYMVSDHGHVWSLRYKQEVKYNTWMGYTLVTLSYTKTRGWHKYSSTKHRRVHRLVLEAFVGPCPEGYETRHLNGKSWDNRLANLEWSSKSTNLKDKQKHGTQLESLRVRCPWDHKLEAPNLVKAALKRGKRNCQSCGRARAFARYRATKGEAHDVRELADKYYAETGLG